MFGKRIRFFGKAKENAVVSGIGKDMANAHIAARNQIHREISLRLVNRN